MARIGIGSFKIKSFTPSELNIKQDDLQDYLIERRQRYFHIAGLPAFGLGKIWRLNKEGKLYEPNTTLYNHLDLCDIKVKTPWYTYGFPIFAILVVSIILSVIKIKDLRFKNRLDNEYEEKRELILEKIQSPTAFDYWKVSDTDNRNDILLKVVEFANNEISFIALEQKYDYNGKDWQMYGEFKDTLLYDTIIVNKDSLFMGIHEDRNEQHWNKGLRIRDKRCKIEAINRINSPYPICEFNWQPRNSRSAFYLELRNRGLKCQLDSVIAKGIEITDIDTLPIKFGYNTVLRLVENKIDYASIYNARIFVYYRDENNKRFVSETYKNDGGLWFDADIRKLD